MKANKPVLMTDIDQTVPREKIVWKSESYESKGYFTYSYRDVGDPAGKYAERLGDAEELLYDMYEAEDFCDCEEYEDGYEDAEGQFSPTCECFDDWAYSVTKEEFEEYLDTRVNKVTSMKQAMDIDKEYSYLTSIPIDTLEEANEFIRKTYGRMGAEFWQDEDGYLIHFMDDVNDVIADYNEAEGILYFVDPPAKGASWSPSLYRAIKNYIKQKDTVKESKMREVAYGSIISIETLEEANTFVTEILGGYFGQDEDYYGRVHYLDEDDYTIASYDEAEGILYTVDEV